MAAKFLGSPHVILPEGIATVDDGVSPVEKVGKLLDGCLGDLTRRQHDPDVPRGLQPSDEILKAQCSGSTLIHQASGCFRTAVVHDGSVSGLHEASDDVSAHPTEAHHSQLH
jgi:hypothetical protein